MIRSAAMTRLSLVLLAALVLVPSAWSAEPRDLQTLGYATTVSHAGECDFWKASGFGASVDFGSTCWPGFQEKLDAFVAGHPERKLGYQHPDAVTARAAVQAKGYTVDTLYEGPAFAVRGDCGVDATVGVAELVALAASLPASAPCPPPAPAEEPPAPPAEPQPDPVEERLTALEQTLAALGRKVVTLQTAIEASWNALVQAWADGLPGDEAALAARSAAMNALYGL